MARTFSVALGDYWIGFVDRLVSRERYGNQSEVIRAALRLLEEAERPIEESFNAASGSSAPAPLNSQFLSATEDIPALFERLLSAEAFREKGIARQNGKAGVYAFFENGAAVHVGRTRNLQGRLRGHITKSHYSASFAFKRTRRLLNVKASYKPEGSRNMLAKDATFQDEFYRQIELVREMDTRFVEVSNPVSQYLLELYGAMHWGLPLDEFDTH